MTDNVVYIKPQIDPEKFARCNAQRLSREEAQAEKIRLQEEECKKFYNWLANASVGEKYCYFQGLYVSGNKIGRVAQNAYSNGFVYLFQKREIKGFSYWAQRTHV